MSESSTLELSAPPTDESEIKHVAPWESFEAKLHKLKTTAV
jgi:hypothetical protein